MLKLAEWLRRATPLEKRALIADAPISEPMLYQIARGHRNPSAELAAKMEKPLRELARGSGDRLPKLTRADISEVCAQCPYAIKCLKKTPPTT